MVTLNSIPSRYKEAIDKIKSLSKYDNYLGAYVFGSVARGNTSINSDLDVNIVTVEDNPCPNINHPFLGGIKLDLNYLSIEQLKKLTKEQTQKNERISWIAESLIIFDKTGELKRMKREAQKVKPVKATKKDYQWIQFLVYHADDKAKRNLEADPYTALLAMSLNVNDILKFYFHINGKWWISNKRLIPELRMSDPKLADLLEKFVATSEVQTKYRYWSEIIDYVLEPIGGRENITENNCTCKNCQKQLSILTG